MKEIQATLNKDQELKVFVTYQIVIHNATAGKHVGEVTQLVDYYDSDYTYQSSYIGDSNRNKKKDITWTQEGNTKNGYHKMTTTGTKGQIINNEDLYLYVTYEVNKDSNGRVLLDDNTQSKQNVVEIMSYISYEMDQKTISGLIDVNSIPGNYDITRFAEKDNNGKYTYIYENDTSEAKGVNLYLQEENRTLNGYVWEDALQTNKKTNVYKDGNGTRDEKEKVIEGVNVELVEQRNGKEYIWQQAVTSKDGFYKFDGYIPGDYFIRFYYGDEKATVLTKVNGGKNEVSYNGQDYKSTVYKEKTGSSWHLNEEKVLISDARDIRRRREDVNNYSKNMTNYIGQVLASYQAGNPNETLLKEMIDNTCMVANTDNMYIGIEKEDTASNQVGGYKAYKIKNIDFGIEKRPEAQLQLTKDLANLKVILEDGTVLFDTSKAQKDVAWQGPTTGANQVTVTMDENLMQGATVELTYKMTVTNVGQTDYVGGNYYYSGKTDSKDKVVTTQATKVVDYVANNLVFDPNRPENKEWQIVDPAKVKTGNAKTTLVDGNIDISQYKTMIETKDSNNLVNKALKPGETTEVASLVLTKVMAKDDANDELSYRNIAEIVTTTNQAGRKHEHSILGNQNPGEDPKEVDADDAERVTILPPYGGFDRTIYYVIAITAAAVVLGTGIILIKKKVINKDKNVE